jgi:type II restriction/modification system DNA methylase subunit YeeA
LEDLNDADYKSVKKSKATGKITYNENIEKHLRAWEKYKNDIIGIKVLDPACGSGAFLNEVFDYLLKEGQRADNEIDRLRGES